MTPPLVSAGPPAARQALFGGEGPRWFTIAAHRPFLDDLAFALDTALSPLGPEALADAVVLTPTRRAARALADAFVRTGDGQAVLLPQIRAIGDLDEGEPPFEPGDVSLDMPPAISVRRRRFELARLVMDHAGLFARALDAPAALELGDALAGFLDGMQIEEIADPARIDTLVEGDLARHWQASARFLKIATEAWPERLRELGLVDVTQRRTALLRALADQWRAQPPERPLIAAGSTGTAPATADLLRVISEAPQGCVVLPGLDLGLADSAWDQVADAHPQGAMRRLLAGTGVAREAVRPWLAPESVAGANRGRARQRVVNEALRPAETTSDWLGVIGALREAGKDADVDIIAQGLGGLSVAATRNEEEAATVIALLLRETLETPGKTAALVTPDAGLARRVSARMSRFGVRVDSSAGAPLAQSSAGLLLGLVARAVARPLEPATLLAILKHPRVRLAREPAALETARRYLERRGLRGARPRDWDALRARLEESIARSDDEAAKAAGQRAVVLATDLRDALAVAGAPFLRSASFDTAALQPAQDDDGGESQDPRHAEQRGEAARVERTQSIKASPADGARALTEAVERLGADARGRTADLWSGADGEAAAEFMASMIQDGAALSDCTAQGFAQVMETLLAGEVVRTGGANHPRLRILGAIEARLIRADRLILAGLEEGVWPRPTEIDPFLSRPMRAKLGLPPPERRTGLSAHDFAQAACAPEVILVHAERRAGAPAVMSRWLWRLETLARGADTPAHPVSLPRRDDVIAWARALDAPIEPAPPSLQPAPRPAPRPPVAARPTQLSVTEVEKLLRDPYAIYARKVLGLRALDRPDERIEARARGSAIHTAFEAFAETWETIPPGEEAARFAELYVEALTAEGLAEVSLARERVLAERAGAWVAELERTRRGACREVLVERDGAIRFATDDGGAFTLTCRADRLELGDGGVHVLDFKTGRPPTKREIESDFAPQLTLTAAIIAGGGFEGVEDRRPGDLVYVRVTGRTPPGDETVPIRAGESEVAAQSARQGLERLIARYRTADQPYRSRVAPRFVTQYPGDYDHLARVREWSAADDEEGAS